MLLIFIVSSILIYYFTQLILVDEMDSDLIGIEGNISNYISRYNTFPKGNPLDEERLNFTETGLIKPIRNVKLLKLYSIREKKLHNFRQLEFPILYNQKWFKVSVAKPVEGMHHLSRALFIVSFLTILITILFSFFLNRIFIKRLWEPFYKSIEIMRNFKIGSNYDLIFPKSNIEEFSFMNNSFLLASEKAKRDYLSLKEFTENASHEMQTPLSIIRSKLDILIQDEELTEKQGILVKVAYSSIKKLSRLNQSLLLLSKIENQQFDIVQEVRLDLKLVEMISQFQELWENNHISGNIDLGKSFISMNPDLLDILLNNLFSNAINHNISPGIINIELKHKYFRICNTGVLEELDSSRLYDRFYKASVISNNNGLGMSIISQICNVSSIRISYAYRSNLHCFTLSW